MIYASRYLLVTLLALGSLAVFYFLHIRQLLHYVWVYYQVALVVAVVVIPLLYMLRVVTLKIMYAVAAQMPLPTKQAPAEADQAAKQSFPVAKPLTPSKLLLP